LNTDGVTVCVFYLPNNKKFSSISAIIKEIKENRNQQFFLVSETAKIEVKEIIENDVFKHIQSHLKSNSKKIRKAIELSILRVLKKSKFHINTINNQNYVSAYHPIVDSTKELNSQSKKIIGVIANYKKTSIKSLISDSEKLNISKINIMKEIKWLIQIGIIRLYESGQIELTNFDKS
jgi:phosphoribosylanthranilate isomerase